MKRKVALALQGGGSHGAYTWGVIDVLLQEPSIEIEGVIGTSAGALNAVALAHGLTENGNDGAKESLARLWHEVGELYKTNPLQLTEYQKNMQDFDVSGNPIFQMMSLMSMLFSPYQLNPKGENPIKPILERIIDFEALKTSSLCKLFVAATHVSTGKVKIFSGDELCIESVMASTCVPTLFKAVEVRGENYWDGGYIGNPAIFPLIYRCETPDIIVVPLRCAYNPRLPTTAEGIQNRIGEITQNSSLCRELRTIHMVSKLIDKHNNSDMKKVRMHMITDNGFFETIHTSSGFCADAAFLNFLYKAGKRSAKSWINKHLDDIGKKTSLNYTDEFLDEDI